MADTSSLPRAEVIERRNLTPDLMILRLRPQIQFSPFKPGQYITIGIDDQERAYSIVSAPHELPDIELFIELVPEEYRLATSLTPRFFGAPVPGGKVWPGLKPGDTVSVRPRAKGAFLLDMKFDNHVFISTVTGIVPFLSMIRSHFDANYYGRNLNILALQGASYVNEFGYLQEMKLRAAKSKGQLFYVPTVSRPAEAPNASWKGVTGRVNAIALEHMQKRGFTPDKTAVYLCGNEKMIDDLGHKPKAGDGKPVGKLVALGYNVKDEVYF